MAKTEISLADAAHELGLTWAQTWALLLSGKLQGRKRGSRWYVDRGDVERRVQGAEVSQEAVRA